MRTVPILIIAALLSSVPSAQQAADEIVLKPTNHPRLASDPSQLWMAPAEARSGVAKAKVGPAEFAAAVKLEVAGVFAGLVRVPVQRRCGCGQHRARFAAAWTNRRRDESVQAGTGPRGTALRRQALYAGAANLRSRPRRLARRRARAGQPPSRRVRLFPQADAQRSRR